MRKIKLAVAAVLVLCGLVAVLLATNLDRLVRRAIEVAGTQALGTAVTVTAVQMELTEGRAVIRGLRIANPEGFSERDMISLDELSLHLDAASLSSVPRVLSIEAHNAMVNVEARGNVSNLSVVSQQMATRINPASSEASPGREIIVERIGLHGIEATLQSDFLPLQGGVKLGDVVLVGFQGDADELARAISRDLMIQLSRNAGLALANASSRFMNDNISWLMEEAGSRLDNLQQGIRSRFSERLDSDVRSRLGLPGRGSADQGQP